MFTVITTFIYGITNMLRGEHIIGRVTACLIMAGVLFLAQGNHSYQEFIYKFTGLLLLLCLGWGKYFMVIHGQNKRDEREFLPADIILKLIERIRGKYVAKYNGQIPNRLYGFIGMFIRWFLMAIPAFILCDISSIKITVSEAPTLLTGFSMAMVPAYIGESALFAVLVAGTYYICRPVFSALILNKTTNKYIVPRFGGEGGNVRFAELLVGILLAIFLLH